jgi:hypothetical protein
VPHPVHQLPRVPAAFENDPTPAVQWDSDDECWYLCVPHPEYSNAILMHELEAEKDDEEGAVKRADAKLASTKRRAKNAAKRSAERLAKTLPLRTFHTGKAFYHAGRRCLGQVEIAPQTYESLEWPGAVNFAFSAEVLIKSLLCLRYDPATPCRCGRRFARPRRSCARPGCPDHPRRHRRWSGRHRSLQSLAGRARPRCSSHTTRPRLRGVDAVAAQSRPSSSAFFVVNSSWERMPR